jgi:hypothetical protein
MSQRVTRAGIASLAPPLSLNRSWARGVCSAQSQASSRATTGRGGTDHLWIKHEIPTLVLCPTWFVIELPDVA